MDMPARWLELERMLWFWFEEITPGILSRYDPQAKDGDWQKLVLRLRSDERLRRTRIEAAISRALRTRQPPQGLSRKDAFYFGRRILCAVDHLETCWWMNSEKSPFGDIPKRWSDQSALRWLLIDLWNRRFDHWLKLHAIAKHGSFPFYGIHPGEEGYPTGWPLY